MPGLVVTATGTDVGKTYVTAGLLRAGLRAGRAMDAFKPVLSGVTDDDLAASDAGRLLTALGRPPTLANVEAISPWRFAAPLSPDMAARREGRAVPYDAVLQACRAKAAGDTTVLIEGVGGAMVPLDERRTTLDLMADLRLPLVLVSATHLGAISHCLCTLEALRGRALAPRVIVLSESADSGVPAAETRETIARFVPGTPVMLVQRDAPDACFDALFAAL